MTTKAVVLALALIAPAANAACESWMATGSTNWIRECNGGREFMDDYPQAPKRGVSHDLYIHDNGQVDVYEHDAITPGDNLRVYDYESSMRVDGGGSTIQQNPPLNTYKPWE